MSTIDKDLIILESIFTLRNLLKQKSSLTKEEQDLLIICDAIYDSATYGIDAYKECCKEYSKLFSATTCPITEDGTLINFRLVELPNPVDQDKAEKTGGHHTKQIKRKVKQQPIIQPLQDDSPKCFKLQKPQKKQIVKTNKEITDNEVIEEALAFGSGMYAAGMDPLALIFKK